MTLDRDGDYSLNGRCPGLGRNQTEAQWAQRTSRTYAMRLATAVFTEPQKWQGGGVKATRRRSTVTGLDGCWRGGTAELPECLLGAQPYHGWTVQRKRARKPKVPCPSQTPKVASPRTCRQWEQLFRTARSDFLPPLPPTPKLRATYAGALASSAPMSS